MTKNVEKSIHDDYEAAVGQLLLEIAEEWQKVQQDSRPSTHASRLVGNVYGALALQLGVRALELRDRSASKAVLSEILRDYRTELVAAVSLIVPED